VHETRKASTKREMFTSTKQFQKIMQGLAERKQQLTPDEASEDIERDEQSYRDRHAQYMTKMKNIIIKSKRIQQEAKETHNKACLKAKENQECFDSAEQKCYAAFSKYTKDLDEETSKAQEEEYYDWAGITCKKCNVRWFLTMKAILDHEKVCKGTPTASLTAGHNPAKLLTSDVHDKRMEPEATKKQSPVSDEDVTDCFVHKKVSRGTPSAPLTAADNPAKLLTSEADDKRMEATKKQSLVSEEDAADGFVHASTGRYKSLADDVPDHINPKMGWYKYGSRKCSKCKAFKQAEEFSTEEANKTADKRVSECCWEKAQLEMMFGAADELDNW